MKVSVSTTYEVYWQLKTDANYKFTKDGKCINSKTGKLLTMKLKNRCKGFYINSKFRSITSLRHDLKKIENVFCPF